MKLCSVWLLLTLVPLSSLAQLDPAGRAQADSVPQASFRLSDPETLPIGASGKPVTGIFHCTSDGSIFLQVLTLLDDPRAPGDVALYAVRDATDIVRFDPKSAPGFRKISPISRYFAAESEVVGLAFGIRIDQGDVQAGTDSKHPSPVLLKFDRKGTLQWTKDLDRKLGVDQIGVFASGDLLLVAWDKSRQKTHLLVTNDAGSILREIELADNDPADHKMEFSPLATLEIRPYGKNLLLIPEDMDRPILEVNEFGVVKAHNLHAPKGYDESIPMTFSPRTWKFRMIEDPKPNQPNGSVQGEPEAKQVTGESHASSGIGLDSLQSAKVVILDFDPDSGDVVRQYGLPTTGIHPACENNGEYTFVSSRAGDGKLQLVRGTASN